MAPTRTQARSRSGYFVMGRPVVARAAGFLDSGISSPADLQTEPTSSDEILACIDYSYGLRGDRTSRVPQM